MVNLFLLKEFVIMNEIWKPFINRYVKDIYSISTLGRIHDDEHDVIMKTTKSTNGNLYVEMESSEYYQSLYKYKTIRLAVDLMMADTFSIKHDPLLTSPYEVIHKDGNLLNCSLDNLELVDVEEDGIKALYWNHVPHGYLGKPKKNRSSYYNMKYRPTKNTNIIYKLLLKHSFNQNELCQLIKEITQYNHENCWYTMDFIQWSIPGKFFIGGKEYNEIKINFSWDLFTRRDNYNFIAQTKNNSNEFSIGNRKWCAKYAQFEIVKGGWYYLA